MKKSIKYVVVLCLLVAMLVPSTAFGAVKQSGNDGCYENEIIIKTMIKSGNFVGFKDLNGLLRKTSLKSRSVAATKPSPAPAPVKPVTPTVPVKPTAPVTPVKPIAPVAPAVPNTSLESNNAVGGYEAQVASLVNKERAAQGLPALKFNSALSKVAATKAADMRDKNYFSHTSPTYGSPFDMMKTFGIKYSTAGENIAKGYRTPDAVMKGWMNSQGHKDNILNSSFTEIGVGYVTDSTGAGYWVQMFIRP